jgi:hypothetical protein
MTTPIVEKLGNKWTAEAPPGSPHDLKTVGDSEKEARDKYTNAERVWVKTERRDPEQTRDRESAVRRGAVER